VFSFYFSLIFLLVGGSAAYQQLPGRRKATNEPGGVDINFSQTEQEPAVIEGTPQFDLLANRLLSAQRTRSWQLRPESYSGSATPDSSTLRSREAA